MPDAAHNIRETLQHCARVLNPPDALTPQEILRRAKQTEEQLGKGRIHEAIEIVTADERRRLADLQGALWLNANDAHLLADAERKAGRS
jgi:predicted nucleic acid-binding protein